VLHHLVLFHCLLVILDPVVCNLVGEEDTLMVPDVEGDLMLVGEEDILMVVVV